MCVQVLTCSVVPAAAAAFYAKRMEPSFSVEVAVVAPNIDKVFFLNRIRFN